ncbi:MAG: VanW family protein [Clostridiaceae bacterium]
MYEKYSGLPDTKKNTPSNGSRPAGRPASRPSPSSSGGQIEYYQAPNRNGDAASAKRSSKRRAKARKRKLILVGMSLAFLALIVVAVVVLVNSCAKPAQVDLETGKFRNGVYINGMDLSGKTVDEVRPQLESNETYLLNNISITLASQEINASITGADMNATSDLNEVIEQALSGGANQVYYTKVSIDDAALSNRIDAINQTSSKPPVDASVNMDFSSSGKPAPQYVEGQPGFGLDVTSTIALVKQAIDAGQYQSTLTPTLTTIQPSIMLTEVQANFSLIAKATTTYSFKGTADDTEEQRAIIPNRAFNVEKAANEINNQVVKPGEKWSFNDVVGDRTEANGWKEANGIFGGDTLTLQFGGGVCQTSTTLYNALLKIYPYIKINQRSRHTIPSTYVEMGLDATVDTDHIDLVFTNTSEHPIYIYAYSSENKMSKSRKRDLNVVIYGQALPEGEEYKPRTIVVSEEDPGEDVITESNKLFVGEEKIQAEARSKYVVQVYIDHYRNGEVVEPIYMYEDTYPGNPLRKLVGVKPTPTPIPSPTPTPTPTTEGP